MVGEEYPQDANKTTISVLIQQSCVSLQPNSKNGTVVIMVPSLEFVVCVAIGILWVPVEPTSFKTCAV